MLHVLQLGWLLTNSAVINRENRPSPLFLRLFFGKRASAAAAAAAAAVVFRVSHIPSEKARNTVTLIAAAPPTHPPLPASLPPSNRERRRRRTRPVIYPVRSSSPEPYCCVALHPVTAKGETEIQRRKRKNAGRRGRRSGPWETGEKEEEQRTRLLAQEK